MNCSVREGAKFTPLEFLKYKSRDLLRIISSSELECEGLVPFELVLADRQIEQIEICKGIGNARNRTSQERERVGHESVLSVCCFVAETVFGNYLHRWVCVLMVQ